MHEPTLKDFPRGCAGIGASPALYNLQFTALSGQMEALQELGRKGLCAQGQPELLLEREDCRQDLSLEVI